jgi:hypothetical protein
VHLHNVLVAYAYCDFLNITNKKCQNLFFFKWHPAFSRLLSKHSADGANIQKSNSFNHFNLCATIWKIRIFEGTPAIRNSGKKSATDQKGWQISKNDPYKFDSQFSIEFKNKIKLGRFRLKKHNFSVFIILRHTVYIPQYFRNVQ